MVQGTSSSAGKTILVAALCRILKSMGFRVYPFKAQNMSLNSYTTEDGCEIARAQALQALACGVEPEVHMNPILLKPSGDRRSQLVLLGRPVKDIDAREYMRDRKSRLLKTAVTSLKKLARRADYVVIEGAGSCAEPNLYDRDIANMKLAEIVGAPVFIVTDIDRGGAFASIVGTHQVIHPEHRSLIKGFILNRFRGDPSLLSEAIDYIKRVTGVPVVGVIPYLEDLKLPSEDSASVSDRGCGPVQVAVVRYPHTSNFTDLEDLSFDPRFSVRYIRTPEELGRPSLLILPGSKNVVYDLKWMRRVGIADVVVRYARSGGLVIGVCGGYQLLGKKISDPLGVEGGTPGEHEALGLLPVVTHFNGYSKLVRRVRVTASQGGLLGSGTLSGYEIRMGEPVRVGNGSPLFSVHTSSGETLEEGCVKGNVLGTSIHGLFENARVRSAIASRFGIRSSGGEDSRKLWSSELDRVAQAVRNSVDLDCLLKCSAPIR